MAIPPKFATAYVASKSVKEESGADAHYKTRRYSFNRGQRGELEIPLDDQDGDGWISVGPKNHHHLRKSFNHDEAHHHRKKFSETRHRPSRGGSSNTRLGSRERKALKNAAAASNDQAQKSQSRTQDSAIDDSVFDDEKHPQEREVDGSDEWITPKKTARRRGSNVRHAIHA